MFDIMRLKEMRIKFRITQQKFAKLANVSQSLVAKIESGLIDPSYSNVLKIEQAINDMANTKEPCAEEIMNHKIVFVEPIEPVKEIIKIMKKSGISQVLVEENNKVIGLVTESSLLETDLEKLQNLRAKDVMLESPPIISTKTKLYVVSALLTQYPIVVIQKDNKYIGVITKSDLLNHLV